MTQEKALKTGKNHAVHENFIIEQYEDNKISIRVKNTIKALQDIANELGMDFEEDWNTQYFGHRVINFINGVDTTRKDKSDSNE